MDLRPNRLREIWNHYMTEQPSSTGVSMTADVAHDKKDEPFFPFALEDLQYWVVKRKDGMIVKYRVIGPTDGDEKRTTISAPQYHGGHTPTPVSTTPSLSGWCKHNPADQPVWQGEKVDLYIADAPGCRGYKDEFNFLLDCGDILPLHYVRGTGDATLDGDEELVRLLTKHSSQTKTTPRCLKIDWDDRAAPPLKFEFWPAIWTKVNKIGGTLLTACQGGHGRSGTSLVCLMMVANPEYSPADAIIHLRAVHCPRAIESVTQHEYIGKFGEFLGRVNDIERVKGVKDFKAEFMKLTLASAKPYQERLMKEGEKK